MFHGRKTITNKSERLQLRRNHASLIDAHEVPEGEPIHRGPISISGASDREEPSGGSGRLSGRSRSINGAKVMIKLGKLLQRAASPSLFYHHMCFAHALHLAVRDTLGDPYLDVENEAESAWIFSGIDQTTSDQNLDSGTEGGDKGEIFVISSCLSNRWPTLLVFIDLMGYFKKVIALGVKFCFQTKYIDSDQSR